MDQKYISHRGRLPVYYFFEPGSDRFHFPLVVFKIGIQAIIRYDSYYFRPRYLLKKLTSIATYCG